MTVAELTEYLADLPPEWKIALVVKFDTGVVSAFITAAESAGQAIRAIKQTDPNGVFVAADQEFVW